MHYLIEFDQTTVSRRKIWVEAETEKQAMDKVTNYAIDVNGSYETNPSISWSISNPRPVGESYE